MAYVIANVFTHRLVSDSARPFAKKAHAETSLRASIARRQKRWERNKERWNAAALVDALYNFEIMTVEEYNANHRRTKKVRSLMNPDVEIEIDINTPASCDPSTETYWSM